MNREKMQNILLATFKKILKYPMWNDLRTYLSSTIEPKEKNNLIAAISYFKKKEGKQ